MTESAVSTSILGDHVIDLLKDWVVEGLVFTTYQYENSVFQELILPSFLGSVLRPNSNSVRRVTENKMREDLRYGCFVFADERCTLAGENGATGATDLIPVRRGKIFHPKVVVGLLRRRDGVNTGEKKAMLLMVTSANLTHNGWQRNVECVASRIYEAGERPPIIDDTVAFLESLKPDDRLRRSSYENFIDQLRAVFPWGKKYKYTGSVKERLVITGIGDKEGVSFVTELSRALEEIAKGKYTNGVMEVISPFTNHATTVDETDESADNGVSESPLSELVRLLKPKSITVAVPLITSDQTKWRREKTNALLNQVESLRWGRLPDDVLRYPADDYTWFRNVHAKVVRLYPLRPLPPWHVTVIGSHNLTKQAYSGKNNIEVSLVSIEHGPNTSKPWLSQIDLPEYEPDKVGCDEDTQSLLDPWPLNIVYDWSARTFIVDAYDEEVIARIDIGEVHIAETTYKSGESIDVSSAENSDQIRDYLARNSFVKVNVKNDLIYEVYVEQINLEDKPPLYGKIDLEDILESLATTRKKPREKRSDLTDHTSTDRKPTASIKIVTLHDRLAWHLRGPIKISERINNLLQGENDSKLSRDFEPKYQLSVFKLVDKIVKADSEELPNTDKYVVLKALQNCLSGLKEQPRVKNYQQWYRDTYESRKELDRVLKSVIKKLRESIATELKAETGEGSLSINDQLKWFDGEIRKPVVSS